MGVHQSGGPSVTGDRHYEVMSAVVQGKVACRASPRGPPALLRSVATMLADQSRSRQLVRVDTATGQEALPSETVRCAEPVTLSIAADVLILSCGKEVTAFDWPGRHVLGHRAGR